MDKREELANLIFKDYDLKQREYYEEKYPERKIEEGALVTRFAPSPTGFLHTGGLYTCLVSNIMARKTNGKFLIRIEDTDRERLVENGIQDIVKALEAYGIVPDEGTVVAEDGSVKQIGQYGPYIQSERKEIYMSYAKRLVEEGKAYPCFYTKEELDGVREKQKASKLRTGMYKMWAKYRDMPAEMAIEKIQAGEEFVLRIKSSGDYTKKRIIEDIIKGKLDLPEDDQDIVIMKKDGLPTYHFAHAIDDHLMRVNMVIRSDEWLPSIALHVSLFLELGFEPPKYAHVAPLLKLEDGNKRKLSKRKDPEAKALEYIKSGVPVEAVEDYLLNIMNANYEMWRKENPKAEMIDFPFDITKMGVAGALFDQVKLYDVSKNYIAGLTNVELYKKVLKWAEEYDKKLFEIITAEKEKTLAVFNIERENAKKPRKDITKFDEIYELNRYMYNDEFEKMDRIYETLDERSVEEKKEIVEILNEYMEMYNIDDEKQEWFNTVKELAGKFGYAKEVKEYKQNPEEYKGHVGDVATIIRVVMTGKTQTPDLYEILRILGKEEMENRIEIFKKTIS